MPHTILFILLGYLSGSIFYSEVAARLFGAGDIAAQAADGNPGVYNAFRNGGFKVGLTALAGDLLKGAVPIYLWRMGYPDWMSDPLLPLVIAAPVLGTLFPVFRHFSGGKGIAVSFSVLLGLIPVWAPVLYLAGSFLFFSLILVVDSHYYRTLVVFICFLAGSFLLPVKPLVMASCVLMSAFVLFRLALKREETGALEVHLLWKH